MDTKKEPVYIITYGSVATVVKAFQCGLCGATASTQGANASFSHYCGPHSVTPTA